MNSEHSDFPDKHNAIIQYAINTHAPLEQSSLLDLAQDENTQENVAKQNRFVKGWNIIGSKWLSGCIRTGIVVDTLNSEYLEGMHDTDSIAEKARLTRIASTAIGGQVYERVRIPEVVGIAVTTNTYRKLMENGWNPGIATTVASLALGGVVYIQQKLIGKNFVKTAERFPESYKTVNQMWPKTMEAVKDATPNPNHRFAEGLTMFGLGTTPFVASAKVSNKNISTQELYAIERRVTRRGSVFAAGIGAIALGMKSLAPYLPEEISIKNAHFSLREDIVNWTNNAIDKISSPLWLIAGIATITALGRVMSKAKNKSTNLVLEQEAA